MFHRRRGLDFNHRRKKISGVMLREIFSWTFGCFAAILFAFVIVYCLGMTTSMIGISMEPSIENGETILVDRFSCLLASPHRGDVIVFVPDGNHGTHYYVKRVIGVPGDIVQIVNGLVYVNGVVLDDMEDYDKIADPGMAESEIPLGKGEFFVLGDNRNNSEDSRFVNIGLVKKANIVGKAWFHLGGKETGIGFVK